MKNTFTIAIMLLLSTYSFSQNDSTKIETYVSFLGYQYIQGETTILMPIDMMEIFQEHPSAFAQMKKASSRRLISQLFYSTGAIFLGYSLVSAITNDNLTYESAGIGAAFIIAGIPFSRGYHKYTQSATSIFNATLPDDKMKAHLQFGVNNNGLGLSIRF